ncbi:MAG: orotidine-5'-phosphate decarboxylase [Acetanaerobacterium sp.]
MSFDLLINKIEKTDNVTVAGLDPKLDYIPPYIKSAAYEQYGKTLEGAAEALWQFNKGLIDALYDIVPSVKPQCAYYEMYGWQGVRAFAETVRYAKSRGLYVVVDGKRNDIGSTMDAYATAYLGKTKVEGTATPAFDGDALTVNGYLGSDGITPLLKQCENSDKGIFVLVKTSNPSSGELQDRQLGDKTVYEAMGELCAKWGADTKGRFGYTAVGAVMGATYPEQLKLLRKSLPETFFLVPGYGAQGGGAGDVAGAFDCNGLGALINSSRAIMCAWQKGGYDEHDYAVAAREEAIRMRDAINEYRG